MSTSVFGLPGLPHVYFDLADLLLIDKEEAGCLTETCNLGGE